MTVNQITRQQIADSAIVEEDELSSSGLSGVPFKSNLAIVSITSLTKTVVLNSSVDLIADPRAQENDIVSIIGGSAEGTYSVDEIINEYTFTVKEEILDSSSGDCSFYYRSGAKITGFDVSTEIGQIINKKNVQEDIESSYLLAKGIKSFPFELHYVSGSGLNTRMSNGAFFRVRPSTFSSGSYSGYPAAFPLQIPFMCKLKSIVLTFREASFDWNANLGPILFEIETRNHYYSGSDITNRILVRFGSWKNSSTGHSTHRFELFYNNTGGDGFEYISGNESIDYGTMIGCRFVKAPSGDRRINSFRDIVMKLNFEEASN